MADSFDPYHIWLGIPPDEQPPNYYRLLGLRDFESNAEVIASASDQRLGYLRSLQIGKRAALSQKLLNEVSGATACLLNEKHRARYDERLRQQRVEREPAKPSAANKPIPQEAVVAVPRPLPMAIPLAPPISPAPPPVAPPIAPADSARPAFPWLKLTALVSSVGSFLIAVVIVIYNLSNPSPKPVDRREHPLAKVPDAQPEEKRPAAVVPPAPPAGSTGRPSTQPPIATPNRLAPPEVQPGNIWNSNFVSRRFTLPSDAELQVADSWLNQKYAAQIQATQTPAQQVVFAEQLTKDVAAESSGPRVHALLARTRQLLAAAGEVDPALSVAVALPNSFQVTEAVAVGWRLKTYRELADAPLSMANRKKLAVRLYGEVTTSLVRSQFEAADECSILALRVAESLGEEDRNLAAGQRARMFRLEPEIAKFRQAQTVLAGDPADRPANLVAAKFHYFAIGNWQSSLNYLEKSDPAFVPLVAAHRAAMKSDPKGDQWYLLHLAAADAWYEWTLSAPETDWELLCLVRTRARSCYQTAHFKLTGAERARADQRIKDIPTSIPDYARPHSVQVSGNTATVTIKRGRPATAAIDPQKIAPAPAADQPNRQ